MTDLPDGLVAHNTAASEETVIQDGRPAVARSTVYYRLGGREYPMKSDHRCGVCQCHKRTWIENALIMGWAKTRIVKALASEGITLSAHSLTTHVQNEHMPLDRTIHRVALEERIREIGLLEEEVESTIVDHIGLLRQVQQRTFERMMAGEIEPEIADGISAANILRQAGVDQEQALDRMVLYQVMTRMMRVAEAIMEPEQYQHYALALQRDTTIAALDRTLRRESALEAASEN